MAQQRFHQMDFCRAVFMYCGVFFHCGLIYGTGYEWRVTSDQTLSLLSYFSNFIHHFRMEAFYLVAGFFYLLLWQKNQRPDQGKAAQATGFLKQSCFLRQSGFLKQRLLRAIIPMLVVGFSLNLVMNQLSYNVDIRWDWSYIEQGKWLSHLWFLGNLSIYFLLAYPVCKYLAGLHQEKAHKPLLQSLLILLAIAVAGQLVADLYDLKTFVFINFYYLLYYFAYFIMGLLAFRHKSEFFQLIHIRRFPIYLLGYALLQLPGKIDFGLNEPGIYLCKLLSHFPLMLAAFSLLCFIGNKANPVVRRFSDASYTIYLLHQPLLIILYVGYFEKIRLGAFTEYLLLSTAVLLVSFLCHFYLVEKNRSLKFLLNGVSNHKNTSVRLTLAAARRV